MENPQKRHFRKLSALFWNPADPRAILALPLLLCDGRLPSEVIITERNKQKRQSPLTLPLESWEKKGVYFVEKNLLSPYNTTPSNPEPRRSIVEGSGTVCPSPIKV
jgi:hypothetical protein